MTASLRHDIVLIGLRGSGKSTVGRMLAEVLAIELIDLDRCVLERLNKPTVAEAWASLGQAAFRDAEAAALAELLALHDPAHPRVIALGGGTLTVTEAQATLTEAQTAGLARAFYLHATPEQLAARLPAHDPDRPSLTDQHDPIEEMRMVYQQRDSLYRQCAAHIIESTTPEETLAAISAIIAA